MDAIGEPAVGVKAACETVGQWQARITSELEPILLKYGVDMWNAGTLPSARRPQYLEVRGEMRLTAPEMQSPAPTLLLGR